jgi:hypothetical protein
MRTIAEDIPVRLYHLDIDSGAATTLFYGTLGAALAESPKPCKKSCSSRPATM